MEKLDEYQATAIKEDADFETDILKINNGNLLNL